MSEQKIVGICHYHCEVGDLDNPCSMFWLRGLVTSLFRNRWHEILLMYRGKVRYTGHRRDKLNLFQSQSS